jgi:hypothetical protein
MRRALLQQQKVLKDLLLSEPRARSIGPYLSVNKLRKKHSARHIPASNALNPPPSSPFTSLFFFQFLFGQSMFVQKKYDQQKNTLPFRTRSEQQHVEHYQ